MPATLRRPAIALASLSIRDFRGIEHLDLDFRGPDGYPNQLIVLAGPNGCGKTAVLEAAQIVLRADDGVTIGKTYGQRSIRLGAGTFEVRGTVSIHTEEQDIAISFPVSHPSIRLSPSALVNHWYFPSWRAPRLVGPVDLMVGKSGKRPVKNNENRLLDVKQQLATRAAVAKFHSERDFSKLINPVNDAWSEFYPDSDAKFFVDITEPDREDGGAFDVFLGSPEGDRLDVDRLSTGQIELFLFFATLALNDHQEGVVLIDEPELHLDPQWHRPILRSLMKLQPRAQFIVATHSPEIYDAAQSYERHFLVPESDPRASLWGEMRSVESGV